MLMYVVLSNACCPRLRIYCLLWPEEEVYEEEDEKVEDDDDGNADGNVERSSPSTAQTCRAASINARVCCRTSLLFRMDVVVGSDCRMDNGKEGRLRMCISLSCVILGC
jgi:hypothetical protein